LKAAKVLWRPSSAWDVDETDDGEKRRSFDESDLSMFPSSPSRSLRVRALRPTVYLFLVLSSFSFGYAHYASGSGWGPGKVSEAALAGLALGYLYIKYGFHTSVLLHWSINYVGRELPGRLTFRRHRVLTWRAEPAPSGKRTDEGGHGRKFKGVRTNA
jgi:hypothetical protein